MSIAPERRMLGEVEMVGRDRWEKIHRRAGAGGSMRAIARELDLDRKTVRRCLRQTEWKPYRRAARADTLLTGHAQYRLRYGDHARRSASRSRSVLVAPESPQRVVRELTRVQKHEGAVHARAYVVLGPRRADRMRP